MQTEHVTDFFFPLTDGSGHYYGNIYVHGLHFVVISDKSKCLMFK